MDEQLRELINLQKEQNELLKKHLWRLRFSLLSLLVLTTGVAIALGVIVYQTRPKAATPVRTIQTQPAPANPFQQRLRIIQPGPAGDLEILPTVPGTTYRAQPMRIDPLCGHVINPPPERAAALENVRC